MTSVDIHNVINNLEMNAVTNTHLEPIYLDETNTTWDYWLHNLTILGENF